MVDLESFPFDFINPGGTEDFGDDMEAPTPPAQPSEGETIPLEPPYPERHRQLAVPLAKPSQRAA